jgi:hypothetical protein
VKAALAPYRLAAQRLIGEPLASPADVVGHLGAVQSQLHDMSLWTIGRRCGSTMAEVEQSFERGEFVRTHALRPTWHHVLPDDLADLLAITAPRVRRAAASGEKQMGFGPDAMERAVEIFIQAVVDDGPLTRAEANARLEAAGIAKVGNSLAHIAMHAELTGRIHNGPVKGKQHTYIAADLRESTRTDEERLAWLATTYGRGHGPFRDRDLAWWASLTLTQARQAIALAGLEAVELADETYYLRPGASNQPVDVPRALLLSNFDEFISYARDPGDFVGTGGRDWSMLMRATGLLFIDGQLAGSWTRSRRVKDVLVEVVPSHRVTGPVRSAIEDEASRYADFVGLPLSLDLT